RFGGRLAGGFGNVVSTANQNGPLGYENRTLLSGTHTSCGTWPVAAVVRQSAFMERGWRRLGGDQHQLESGRRAGGGRRSDIQPQCQLYGELHWRRTHFPYAYLSRRDCDTQQY